MARINKTRYAVLGCLAIHPMTAYDIKQFMGRSTSFFWTESEGQLYPTLTQLAEENFVQYTEEAAEKRGTKKIYQITDKGLEYLHLWLAQPIEVQIYRNELLLKLFFGNNQNTVNNINHLQTSIPELTSTLNLLKNIKTNLMTSDRSLYIEITLDYGISLIEAELAWCHKSIELLKNRMIISS
jgi:PadR family transcriptional regulator AphA